jgi:hypothetical protein
MPTMGNLLLSVFAGAFFVPGSADVGFLVFMGNGFIDYNSIKICKIRELFHTPNILIHHLEKSPDVERLG